MRIIGRIDIKNNALIKGISFEGLRRIGSAAEFAKTYYDDGIDELLLVDAVASYYNRNSLTNDIAQINKDVFVPCCVAGGIRTVKDAKKALEVGADKIALNSVIFDDKKIIEELVGAFGSQSIVGSIEFRFLEEKSNWEAMFDNGRELSGWAALDWAQELENLGVGEILATSVDRDGSQRGFDVDFYEQLSKKVNVPIIASGGAGSIQDICDLAETHFVDAIAVGSVLHYKKSSVRQIKSAVSSLGINVRP